MPLWNVPPASARLPLRSLSEERTGAALGAAAVLWALFVSAWGLGGPFPDGHFASVADVGVSGLNMVRWKIIFPAFPLLDHPPSAGNYYMHHPLGIFWTIGLLIKVFGDHDWVLRLPPLLYVPSTAFFLHRCGRAIWGPIEGGLAALAYAALPITLGFANYHDLEQPVMLGCVVATWGYVRFRQTDRDLYALASVAGFAFALLHDWEAYIWGATFLGFVFLRGFVIPPRWLGDADARKLGRYWGLMSATAVVLLVGTVALIIGSDRLADTLAMYDVRSSGRGAPLGLLLEARHVRIELMFTALGIALGKLAVPVILARFVLRRSELELLPLFLLIMAIGFYVWFKQGADVHIFWPHPFAVYFALAIGALAATTRDAWVWAARHLPARPLRFRPRESHAPWIALSLVGLSVVLVLRDGASLIRLARESGGRFMEAQLESEVDKNVALRWFLRRFPSPAEKVAFHASANALWETHWAIRPHALLQRQPVNGGKAPPARPYMLDARTTSVAELREAARLYHVQVVGSYWLFDRGAPPAPLDGYSFDEHDPGLLESFWHGATEPIRQVVPDPWVTWEWRSLLGQQPVEPPRGQPHTLEQLRIAHNVALAQGDTAAAARLRQDLQRRLDIPLTARWQGDTALLGTAHHRQGARSLTPYLLAGTLRPGAKLAIHARVTGRRFLSTLPVDPADLDIAYRPPIPMELWVPGRIYSVPVVYRHRAGHEEFKLGLVLPDRGRGPTRADGGPEWIPLLRL